MDKIKEFLKNKELPYEYFATYCRITPRTLRRIFKGFPCYKSTAERILKYLHSKGAKNITLEDFNIQKKG